MHTVNAQPRRSTTIALLLAAGIIVVLIGVVFSFVAEVRAHPCNGSTHNDAAGVACGDPGHATISSDEPGDAVGIHIGATAEGPLNAGDTITVDFPGFNLPTSITNPTTSTNTNPYKVTITSGTTPTTFPPEEIVRQGSRVTLTIPAEQGVPITGNYTINFHQRANIKNPYYAGDWTITVTSSLSNDVADTSMVTISRITRIRPPSPVEGPRGTEFTLEGKGYAQGTVTIFDGDDDNVDEGEVLATVRTGTGIRTGAFTASGLKARGSPGSLTYVIRTKDSAGVVDKVDFHITTSVSFEPSTVIVGSEMTINIADWQDQTKGVAAVRIGGEVVYIAGVREYAICYEYTGVKPAEGDLTVSFTVTVPEDIITGEQTVSIYDEEQLEVTGLSTGANNRCPSNPTGNPVESDATVKLKSNATPTIQKTVEIVSQLPPIAPLGLNILEVDGGRDRELEFQVNPPASNRSSYLDAGDQIEISLPGFDLSGAAFSSQTARERIELRGSDASISDAVAPTQVDVDTLTGKLTLTLPALELGSREYLNITIEQGTRILTPEVPRGFDDPDEGYPITVTFIDAASAQPAVTDPDANVVVVKNPISSSVPNATVRVDLFTYAEAEIGPGQEITVDFSGPSADSEFVVPTSITPSRVTIDPERGASFSPSDVLVQGARVILTIPTGTTPIRQVPVGEYEIRFSQLARIRNPFAAGNQVITVSSTTPGDKPDEITAVIKRTTTIEPLEGPRGTEFELEGKGYARGTVTVYHDADNDAQIDAGETLASVNTVRGAFSVDLVARGERGALEYRVRTRDSEGAGDERVFRIRSGMFFNPPAARVGWPLRITISDWQDLDQEVAAVSVAGETAYVAKVKEYDNCFEYTGLFLANTDGVITLEIEVPRHVPEGEQTVSLYGHDQLEHFRGTDGVRLDNQPCEDIQGVRGGLVTGNVESRLKIQPIAIIKATLEIDTSELTLSPSAAARGQKVTITGSGFTRAARGSDHIDSVWIGGRPVEDDRSGFVVGSNGDIAFTVTVPLDIPDGHNEVRIEGADHTLGQAILTIPQAAISLDPPLGQRGTDFTIRGSGFIANSVVYITYGAGVGATLGGAEFVGGVLADSRGEFELLFQVPFTAVVGKRHLVKAVGESANRGVIATVEAEASHLIPRADITTTPDSVSPGDRLTISGQNLPSFAPVGPITIEGIKVLGKPGLATDENGSFETDVLIPNLDFGDQTLVVQVAAVVVPHIVTLAPPPLSGPPSQVFKYLIRDGVLSAVWSYDNATQSWNVFDPSLTGEMATLNDLTIVDRGDIVWVNLRRPQRFQDAELLAGWNLISLK